MRASQDRVSGAVTPCALQPLPDPFRTFGPAYEIETCCFCDSGEAAKMMILCNPGISRMALVLSENSRHRKKREGPSTADLRLRESFENRMRLVLIDPRGPLTKSVRKRPKSQS
jgi:hypothetical protein